MSPAKTAAPIEMPFGLGTRVGPKNHVLDGGPDPPMGMGNFEEGKGRPIVKYRDTLRSSVQKRPNRSRCHLGCGLGWPKESCVRWGPAMLRDDAMATKFGTKIAINWLCVNDSD